MIVTFVCEPGYGGEQAEESVSSLCPLLGREFTPASCLAPLEAGSLQWWTTVGL